jgi:hypothetical protein
LIGCNKNARLQPFCTCILANYIKLRNLDFPTGNIQTENKNTLLQENKSVDELRNLSSFSSQAELKYIKRYCRCTRWLIDKRKI